MDSAALRRGLGTTQCERPQEKLESYAIFGKPALAVADAVVESVIDGQPEQTPGKYPTNIPLDEADGNSVILDLGEHRYALYATCSPAASRCIAASALHSGRHSAWSATQVSRPCRTFTSSSPADHPRWHRMVFRTRSAFPDHRQRPWHRSLRQIRDRRQPPSRRAGLATQERQGRIPLDQYIISFKPY
jgi:hypothetical protein